MDHNPLMAAIDKDSPMSAMRWPAPGLPASPSAQSESCRAGGVGTRPSAAGEPVRALKSDPAFIALREHLLDTLARHRQAHDKETA